MKNRAVFLDRDGTLIEERGHISSPKQVRFIRGAFTALRRLQMLGFKLVIVSNQSGVARGILTEAQVRKVNQYILSELEKRGLRMDGLYYCPHHPKRGNGSFTRKCSCRKPSDGMIQKGRKRLNIDTQKSYVMGDKLTDVELGRKVRSKTILLLTGFGREELARRKGSLGKPDKLARNILEGVKWIARDVKK
jgi:D,D-heptose 1,7-bisphosphate phosphatase